MDDNIELVKTVNLWFQLFLEIHLPGSTFQFLFLSCRIGSRPNTYSTPSKNYSNRCKIAFLQTFKAIKLPYNTLNLPQCEQLCTLP